MNILDFIPYGHDNAVRRGTLCRLTKLEDRTMRETIEKARNNGALILNLQDGAGYFQPILPEEANLVKKYRDSELGRLYCAATNVQTCNEALQAAERGDTE